MTHLDRLGGALAEVETPLGRAIKETIGWTDWLDNDLQLTYSFCGLATAALQRYLEREVGVVTSRLRSDVFIDLPDLSDEVETHVVLETNEGIVIDPTYTQFFKFVGLSSQLAQQYPHVRALLPAHKITTFARGDHREFAQKIADNALSVGSILQPQLNALEEGFSKPLFHSEAENAIRRADKQMIENIYLSMWHMPSYRPYSVESQAAQMTDGDGIVDEVLGKLI